MPQPTHFVRSTVFPLEGFVDLRVIYPVVTTIGRQAKRQTGTYYVLDCSRVQGFSSQALAEIIKLRWEVRTGGCDVVLMHCSVKVRQDMIFPLFASLMAREPGPHIGPADKVPQTAPSPAAPPLPPTPPAPAPLPKDLSQLDTWHEENPIEPEEVPFFIRNKRFYRYWMN